MLVTSLPMASASGVTESKSDGLTGIEQAPQPPSARALATSRLDSLALEVPGRGPGTARVEVLVEDGQEQEAVDAIDEVGGRVVAAAGDVILADVPAAYIPELAHEESAAEVRDPALINVFPSEGEYLTNSIGGGELAPLVNADDWHAHGHVGSGVKIGIVDFFDGSIWSSAQSAGSVPAPSGVFCQYIGSACDIWTGGSGHGVAVADGIHQIAPGAQLYVATVGTVTDLAAAVDWFVANGVTIVSRSLGSYLDSAGDGSGPLNTVVDDAVGSGLTWFNAAGNHAGSSGFGGYWRGTWVDLDLDGYLEFAPGDELLGMSCLSAIQGFRWSDWSGNATDYDVFIYDDSGTELLAASTNTQSTGAQPLEFVEAVAFDCNVHPTVRIAVRLFSAGNGTVGDVLEFMVNGGAVEHSTNAYSASGPIADSKSTGAMTVGAIDPGDGSTIASYSSRGPTNDERIKPDIAAPSCYLTSASSPSCFNGTSAATPVVAGLAAIIAGSGIASTPTEITSYLATHAIDRGVPGPDNTYGNGQVRLGDPPTPLEAGAHSLVLVDPNQGQWHFYNGSGHEEFSLFFGNPGDYPIMGDWNCDGVETPGMYRQSDGYVYLRNTNTQGIADIRFFFGDPGDVPIAGDFNGDGCGTVSIYRPSNQTFYIINKLGANDGGLGAATTSYVFGNPGDKPFVGDFDGDGVETVGLHRESTGLVYFRNSHTQGNADEQFIFGDPGDRIVAGDWNEDGSFSPALYRPSGMVAYFRFTNTQGNADAQFQPNPAGSNWLPVASDLD